jgi:zinc transporter, ZIP family
MSEMTANEMSGKSIEVPSWFSRLPSGVLAIVPAILLIGVLAVIIRTDGGLGDRTLPPIETLNVQRVTLPAPGQIEVEVINGGPDEISIAQVLVDDAYWQFTTDHEGPLGRLDSATLSIPYPWVQDEAHMIQILTSTGTIFEAEIPVAFESPEADRGSVARFALVGIYVGVIPIALGMLWLPWVRRIPPEWVRAVMALTIGLLAFLAVDATLEGFELAGEGSQVFGGGALVLVGAAVAYLALSGVSSWLTARRRAAAAGGASGATLALLVAVGIGLHNLGEGVAIGAAYSAGALALGAFLVIGFALHNTTEGLAIVAPVARTQPSLRLLAMLGLLAGAPAVLGAWIGAAAFNTSLAAFLFGFGAGAIAQVIVQLAPTLRDGEGRLLHPAAVSGILLGMASMFATGLLVSV